MRNETAKRAALILVSTALSLVLFVGAYELLAAHRYEKWKTAHKNSKEWYGGLTVASDNPTLIWEYRANGLYQDEELGYTIRTNRFGFRGSDDIARKKPAEVLRYAFLGDSVTLGLNVHETDTFVTRLAELSRKPPQVRRLESLNFGVDGYNTVQIAELLEKKVMVFNPDKVVYVLCLNDFDFEDASGQKIRFFNKPASFFLSAMSRLHRLVLSIDYYDFHFRKNKTVVFQQIRRMKRLLADRGMDFEILLIPIFRQSDSSFKHYPLAWMHREISDELARTNIFTLDMLQVFSELGGAPAEYSLDEWHPNAEGHEIIATTIYQGLPDDAR